MTTAERGEYIVTVTDDDGRERERYVCHTHEGMEQRIAYLRHKHSGIRWVAPQPEVVKGKLPRRRKINRDEIVTLTLLYVGCVAFAIAGTLLIAGDLPAAWNALVQFATAPVVVDNAIGLLVTVAGLAVIRHLRSRPGGQP